MEGQGLFFFDDYKVYDGNFTEGKIEGFGMMRY
jgi:hypothetical protein